MQLGGPTAYVPFRPEGAATNQPRAERSGVSRDDEHLYRVVQYIGRNPSQAGLPRESWHRWLHPDWEACGWRFEDEVRRP